MKENLLLNLRIALLCFSLITVLIQGQSVSSLFPEELDRYLNFKTERDNIPGLEISLIGSDGTICSKGYGWADIEKRIPMTESTVISAASVSKLMTAAAVLQLIERKQLDIDAPVNKYLPFKVINPRYPDADITVSMLLNHTSSVSNGPSLWRIYRCGQDSSTSAAWCRDYFLPSGRYYDKEGNFSNFKPGSGFQYSNAGYGLLACLVEIASGLSFENYCQKNIFSPLEMKSSSFNVSGTRSDLRGVMYSYGYTWQLEKDLIKPGIDYQDIINKGYFFPLCSYSTPLKGAGSLYTSVADLSKFTICMMNGGIYKDHRLLSRESIDRLFASSVGSEFLPGQFHSYGWGGYALSLSNGAPVYGHTGAEPGVSSFLLFNTEINLGVIVLANRYADIRDIIEWAFAEGYAKYSGQVSQTVDPRWSQYSENVTMRSITFNVTSDYLPGGSKIYISGSHRYIGSWSAKGMPLLPMPNGSWQITFKLPANTKIEYKITRGSWSTEAAAPDGRPLPNFQLSVEKDSLINIHVTDWKDLAE